MKRNQHVYMIIFIILQLVEDIFGTYQEEKVYDQHNYILLYMTHLYRQYNFNTFDEEDAYLYISFSILL